jgi:Fe-S-cluster-containing hydrogenase component 2
MTGISWYQQCVASAWASRIVSFSRRTKKGIKCWKCRRLCPGGVKPLYRVRGVSIVQRGDFTSRNAIIYICESSTTRPQLPCISLGSDSSRKRQRGHSERLSLSGRKQPCREARARPRGSEWWGRGARWSLSVLSLSASLV